MVFEEFRFKSDSFGEVCMRIRSSDMKIAPGVALGDAENNKGFFCLAQVKYQYGFEVKKSLSEETYLFIKNKLLAEIMVAQAAMEPEIKRVAEKEKELKASKAHPKVLKRFLEQESEPINHANLMAHDMGKTMVYWQYEEKMFDINASILN